MLRPLLVAALVLLVVAPPVAYRSYRSVELRNFRAVADGRLYRSGQLTPAGFERVVREYGIRTVISLRDTKDDDRPPPDAYEAEYCRAHGVAHHRLSPASWAAADGTVPAARNVAEFLRILADPATERPVLVHCFAGIHRTGAYCAVYRMEYDGWPAADAIAEMRGMGTVRTTFEDDVLGYLEGYTPRAVCRPPGGR
jgi:protein tyrosine/serine phosphatase